MNEEQEPPPIPTNFGFRYVLWVAWWNLYRGTGLTLTFIWANAITILSIVSAIFAAMTLDPTIVDHETFHYILIGQMVLTAILAQIKRQPSPPPPPSKDELK
jgi:hypothetical protein